jgi:type VI secretion system secreted protein VgrG
MATMTQADREFQVSSSLGKDVLLFNRMTATEGLSGIYEINLSLLSANGSIDAKKILGTPVGVSVALPAGGQRYFHGLCTDFAYTGHFGELYGYRAILRPWLWVLTRSADCRIFQKKTTVEIIKQIISDQGFSADVKESLSRTYQPWEYCVQYRETAFNFISRLMEHEGIYYYFEHAADKHTMVLVDASSAHSTFGGYAEVPYYPPEQTGRRKRDSISDWSMSWEIQSGKVTHTDYDFTKPSLNLLAQTQGPAGHGYDSEEVYDYPGIYTTTDLGGSLAKIRLDELRTRFQIARGHGDARGLLTGSVFKLTGYPRSDQNAEYLVTSTTCQAVSNEYSAGAGAGEYEFSCSFTAISSKEQYRAPRVTPKPVMNGPQTALVVGSSGEEIYTDEYGRIMVQFYWDRVGQKNENSSCWIRVGQLWASSGWGSMWIPRVGMEVIVDFIEGDPDRPIVIGCVYNGNNKPPYSLPSDKTKSTIKSNSSKGGGGSNEIRFEDKKGSEEIYIHAQKDRNLVIENDETKKVGNNQVIEVKNDRTETVQQGNEKVTISQGNRTITVSQGNDSLIVSQGDQSTTISQGNQSTTISQGNQSTKISAGSATTEAMQSITLKVGSSSVTIDQTGVTIKGMTITIQGEGQTQVQASGMVQVKGALVQIN